LRFFGGLDDLEKITIYIVAKLLLSILLYACNSVANLPVFG